MMTFGQRLVFLGSPDEVNFPRRSTLKAVLKMSPFVYKKLNLISRHDSAVDEVLQRGDLALKDLLDDVRHGL